MTVPISLGIYDPPRAAAKWQKADTCRPGDPAPSPDQAGGFILSFGPGSPKIGRRDAGAEPSPQRRDPARISGYRPLPRAAAVPGRAGAAGEQPAPAARPAGVVPAGRVHV